MSDVPASNETALAVISTLTPVALFAPGKVGSVVERLEREVRAVKTDISTVKGRAEIKSLAYKVARSKTALDGMGKQLTDTIRKQAETIHAERRLIVTRLDALAEEVRRPLTKWEEAEAARLAQHEAALEAIVEHPDFGQTETTDDLRRRLASLQAHPARDWQEFAERAKDALADEVARTSRLLAAAGKREADAAELSRLRAEAEERERQAAAEKQVERERQIAAQAAERARLLAEQEAERRHQETLRAAAEQRVKAERDRFAAEQHAQAELRRTEAARQAAEDRAARAEQERIATEQRAKAEADAQAIRVEQARIAAAERAAREQREAVEAEQRLAAETRAAERAEANRRAADNAHRGRVNRGALEAITLAISEVHTGNAAEAEAIGKTVIAAVAGGKIPNLSIAY